MKVLVADDHPMLRDALARTLQGLLPAVQVIEAGDAAETEAALREQAPQLALLDLHMPGMAGAEGLRRLHALHPGVRLAVVSGDDDPAVVRAVLAAGAVAFLPKREQPEAMLHALRMVLAGGSYVPSQALADLGAAAAPGQRDIGTLTSRQRDVLACLLRGQPNKLIARELGLTEGTVKIHIAAILRALRARNRTEAVVRARELGLGG